MERTGREMCIIARKYKETRWEKTIKVTLILSPRQQTFSGEQRSFTASILARIGTMPALRARGHLNAHLLPCF